MCRGERDLLGNVYRGPNRPLTERSFQLVSHRPVGGYALQIKWGDGHDDGSTSRDAPADGGGGEVTVLRFALRDFSADKLECVRSNGNNSLSEVVI